MSQYLLSFAKRNLQKKSDAYLIILWCVYQSYTQAGRYSEHIKNVISNEGDILLKKNFQRTAARFSRVLQTKPELDWIAPEGLSAVCQLRVKNFRGFGELNKDDEGTLLNLSKVKNIFYAPNGGGKTSLCEALEFGTTGHIKEADRRKTKLKQYISRNNLKPVLTLHDIKGEEVKRNLQWSSCFIDRNRLQEFSLLGSKDTGSQEKDVIATLFGLEEFQSIISRFVLPNSFNLSLLKRSSKNDALKLLQDEITRYKAGILQANQEILEQNNNACKSLGLKNDAINAVRYKQKFLQKLSELKFEKVTRLKSARSPNHISLHKLQGFARLFRRSISNKNIIERQFLEHAASLNYRAIFEAISAIELIDPESKACPACSTPFDRVTENPFDRAKKEVLALSYLDTLKGVKAKNEQQILKATVLIERIGVAINDNLNIGITCGVDIHRLLDAINVHKVSLDRLGSAVVALEIFTDIVDSQTEEIEHYINTCAKKKNEHEIINTKIRNLESDIAKINNDLKTFDECVAIKKNALKQRKDKGENISRLIIKKRNIELDDDKNEQFNLLLDAITAEYKNVYNDLQDFKLSLESERIAGIESKAAEYYQLINNHDDDHEKIASIKFLKSSEGYRIGIETLAGQSLDAFSVLSEGHLRVLGLSLLLAMAEKNKLPIIVFDDVVNAIDSDHRANIIALFFEDKYLQKTQMVVTTHDRLFWERFCIAAEKNTYADQNSSYVSTYTNKGIVFIDYKGGFKSKIENALSVFDIRQALIYCRIWFESLVVNFCLEKEISITARFSRSQLKEDRFLQISLENTFKLIEPHIAYNSTKFDLIKNNLINWSGQNQAHHAFDEFSFNFVHSKTSGEVLQIFDAIRLFECQLFPSTKRIACEKTLSELIEKIEKGKKRLLKLEKAPLEVQERTRQEITRHQASVKQLQHELLFITECEDALKAKLALAKDTQFNENSLELSDAGLDIGFEMRDALARTETELDSDSDKIEAFTDLVKAPSEGTKH